MGHEYSSCEVVHARILLSRSAEVLRGFLRVKAQRKRCKDKRYGYHEIHAGDTQLSLAEFTGFPD